MESEQKKEDTGTVDVAETAKRYGLTHGDEYKFLREEIMQRIKDIHQMELYGAIGLGFIYSWCIVHKSEITTSIIWWIGPCVFALCGISALVNVYEIWRIGQYLARIEEVVFANDEKLIGWEREQRRPGIHQRFVSAHLFLALSLWIFALALTIWASWALSHS